MDSIKIIHYTHTVYADGTSPIIIQLISNRKAIRKVIAKCLPEQWDDKAKRIKNRKHPNAEALNKLISDEFNLYENQVLCKVPAKHIFKKSGLDPQYIKLSDLMDIYLSYVVKSSGMSYLNIKSRLGKFLSFAGKQILVGDIDKKLMSAYIISLERENLQPSTIRKNLTTLRNMDSYCVKRDLCEKIAPFYAFDLPKANHAVKNKLTSEEFKRFCEVDLAFGSVSWEIQQAFMLAVYLRGMRISDIILMEQKYVSNGRLKYTASKTGKSFDIKIVPQAQAILDQLLDDRKYVFNFYRFQAAPSLSVDENEIARTSHIKSITAMINKYLKVIAAKAHIEKTVTTHIARHTFAKLAADQIFDRRVTMDLMGHSSLDVHERYIKEISKDDDLDNAVDNIF